MEPVYNPEILAGLQQALNAESSLMLQYRLDQRNVKRLGLSLACGLKKLSRQCESYVNELADALYFTEARPELAPASAQTNAGVQQIIDGAIEGEKKLLELYTVLCKAAYEAGEMDIFHLYQHLTKWHRRGGNGNEGHLAWLRKQSWQLTEFGENGYEQVKAINR